MARTLHSWLISPDADAALERWSCAAINGEPQAFPASVATSPRAILQFVEFHGITGLLSARAAARDEAWPGSELRDALSRAARYQTAYELVLREELERVITAAAAHGLTPLLLKGAALAYSVYPEPALRARNDTDLLVSPSQKAGMTQLLQALGYTADLIAGDHWATSERGFRRSLSSGVTSRIDLHWRINNSPVFWHAALDHARLWATAQPLTALHPQARRPSIPLLLLHACIHRARHFKAPLELNGVAYVAANRLIWLYDIHLLARMMSDAEWAAFLALAVDLGVCGVCRSAIEATAERFPSPIPDTVLEGLASRADEVADDHLAASAWRIKWTEFRALPSAAARVGWLREHLFPSPAYMRVRFADQPHMPLLALYVKRLLPGQKSKTAR